MKSKSWRTFISIPAVLAILICQLSLVYSHVFAEPASTSKSVFNAKEEYSDTQGEIWQYKSRDIVSNTYTDMTYSDGVWSGNGASIRLDASGNMYVIARDGAYQAVLEFVAPYSGTIDIKGKWYSARTETRFFTVWNGTTPLMDQLTITAAGSSDYSITDVSVKQGDRIRFLVTSSGTDAPLYIGMSDTPITITYKSSDATLSSLTASGITFNEPFSPATTTYTATVETSVTSTTLAATAADAKASIAEGALGEKALKMGLNTFAIPVTAEDGTVVTYTLNITRTAVYSFNAKEEYSDTQGEIWQYKSRDIVNNTYTDMTYSDGVWSGNGASIRLDASGNMYMTARDGAYQAVLEFVAPYSGTIDIYGHWYSSRTETRHFNIWNGTTPLMDPLIVTAAGSSEYSVTSVSVKQGDRIRFLVAAEGNTDAPLYIGMADTPVTIAYSEVKSSDATLSSLTASGITFNEPFSPATTTYTATVETSVTSTTLAATAADAKASIAEGALGEKALKMGLNTFAIPVTAEDGTIVTYTLNITVNGGLPTYSAKADFSSQQGDIWKYWSREVVSNIYTPLEWDAVNERWTDGKGGMVADTWIHASADASSTHEAQMVLEFTCPESGVVTILDEFGSVWLSDSSGNGAKLWVWLDNSFLLDKTFQAGESMELNLEDIEVSKGQKIRFILSAISGNNAGDILHIAPYIIYTAINEDDENDPAKPGTPSPNTGVAFPLAVVSTLIGSGAIIAVSKKRRCRK